MLEQMIVQDIIRKTRPDNGYQPAMSAWRREMRLMNSVLNHIAVCETPHDQPLCDYVQRRTDNILALLGQTE